VNQAGLRASFGVAAVLAAACVSGNARAQGVDMFGPYGGLEHHRFIRTKQEVAFEVRFGPYAPNIDQDIPGQPYKEIFGNDTRWQGGAELDWQLYRIPRVLSLGPGFGFGYTHASGKAPLTNGTGTSAQSTTLGIFPMHLVAALRFDYIADHTPVPLQPYAKLGLGYALWWSSIGDSATHYNGDVGKGASYGYVWALGVVLRLDPLEPAAAANADASLGINHAGLFIEWFNSSLNGFGSSSGMEVGTNTWVTGLTLEI
jgi:hypothetical protein